MSVAYQIETAKLPIPTAVQPPAARRSVVISLNPRAGSRSCQSHVQAIERMLSKAGFNVRMTTDLKELALLAAAGQDCGELRAVIAVGGDGTASVVRNHVPLAVPIVPVPMGTENLLGRYVGQTTDPASVCQTVAEGVTVGLDLGSANGKHFLLMVSAGFDAEVVRSLHENRRGNITRRAYFLPMLRAMRHYGYPEMQLYSQDAAAPSAPLRCRWLFGFNLPLYALGMPIAPDAVATDGMLDVCAFERGRAWSVARYWWHVWRRSHVRLTDVRIVRSRRFRLEAPGAANLAYQLDGDHGGTLPVDVEVLTGELRLLVSREAARKLGFALPET
jgi:diacylglycerol kinase family enzyme